MRTIHGIDHTSGIKDWEVIAPSVILGATRSAVEKFSALARVDWSTFTMDVSRQELRRWADGDTDTPTGPVETMVRVRHEVQTEDT